MMNCDFIFNGDLKLSLETDSVSPIIDFEVIKAINNASKDQKELFYKLIEDSLARINNPEKVSITAIREKEGLVTNATLEDLRNEYPDIEFPENVRANILLIDNFVNGGKNMRGRIIDTNGQPFFVIKGNNYKDLYRLSSYLLTKAIIEANSYRFDESTENYKDLLKILEIRNKRLKNNKLETILDLILDFSENGSVYRNIEYTPEGKEEKISAYFLLSDIRNKILERPGRTSYEDRLVNNLYLLSIYKGNGDILLEYSTLYNSIKGLRLDIANALEHIFGIKTQPEFVEILKNNNLFKTLTEADLANSEVLLLLRIFVDPEQSNFFNLLNFIFDVEPDFVYEYQKTTKDGLIMHATPKTIREKYGIEYDTINGMDIEQDPYRGYKIYKHSNGELTYYIPSRGYLTEDYYSKRFETIEKALEYIDKLISNLSISKNSFVDFKFRKYEGDTYGEDLEENTVLTKQYLIPRSVVESLDIPINPLLEIYNLKEKDILSFDSLTILDFQELVKTYNISSELKKRILEEINNPEKVSTFIYKINEILGNGFRNNENNITEVLNLIRDAKIKNYYIESREYDYKKKVWNYTVIPITEVDTLTEYLKNKNYPISKYMQGLQLTLKEKFNVDVLLKTADELKEFSNIDVNTTKAFIRNGVIYVNTTIASTSDMLHEYTHLLLGLLRSNPELRSNYEQMLYAMMNTKKAKKVFAKLSSIYSDRSEVDIMEETFAKLFSEFLTGKLNSELKELNDIFKSNIVKEGASKLFNLRINNIKSFFGLGISSMFNIFSLEVLRLLNSSELLDFDTTKTSRRYSTWISEKLRNNELLEECI